MCELILELDDTNWAQVADYRIDLACSGSEALAEMLAFLGETDQPKFLSRLIHHGCDACCISVRKSDRRLLGTVLRFDMREGTSAEYDAAAGTIRTCLDGGACTSLQLPTATANRLETMIRDIWREARGSSMWRKTAEEDGVITAELVK